MGNVPEQWLNGAKLTVVGTLLIAFLTGCSDTASSSNRAPAVDAAFNALNEAYVLDVKPADAKYAVCKYTQVDGRHAVRCGLGYTLTSDLVQVGYWEIEIQGDGYAIYAMNGKALTALDRITRNGSHSNAQHPGVFHPGQGRTPLDIGKINQAIQ